MNKAAPINTGEKRRWMLAAGLALLVVLGASAYWHLRETATEGNQRRLSQARALYLTGKYRQAEELAASVLDDDPQLAEAALWAARSAAAREDYQKAAEYVKRTKSGDRQVRISADIFAAELHHYRLHHLSIAEEYYRAVLANDPDNLSANKGLAALLGLCGRGREAVPFVLKTVQLGQPTDQLFLIARPSGFVSDTLALEEARVADPQGVNTLLGLAWQASAKEKHDQASELLQEAVRLYPEHVAASLAWGRQLLVLEKFDELVEWINSAPDKVKKSGDYWLILGRIAERQNHLQPAIRCYWEAIRREPESRSAFFRLIKLLSAAAPEIHADPFVRHYQELGHLFAIQDRVWSGSETGTGPVLELVNAYETMGRFWEAYGWSLLALERYPGDRDLLKYISRIHPKAQTSSLKLTADAANPAIKIDLSHFSMPILRQESATPERTHGEQPATLTFRNEAEDVGLHFVYFNGTTGAPTRKMFELTGGGIGVLDFDLDGFSDVFFSQGRSWTPGSSDKNYQDQLFQNHGGKEFRNVTKSAGIQELGFGQGVTVGDFNSDGFPDLYVANIGTNQLWMNNGDGTFTGTGSAAGIGGEEWTTSCLMVDLSGDGHPEIYDVNYLTGDGVFDRVCRQSDGTPAQCRPFDFEGEVDRFWLNSADGQFVDATRSSLSRVPNGKGLGVAAWDARSEGRLSLFVANDTTANFFFAPKPHAKKFYLEEQGLVSGLACNGEGKAEGCMGVALADVDGNGQLDVHVTNFLAESNTLWMQTDGVFEDTTRGLGLHVPTLNTLGFGTQFLDANLDGRYELFVSNGHVDDLRASGRPYKMLPQLFQWNGREFIETDAVAVGTYFEKRWLGRAVARIDWNRDGRNDLLVGHLFQPSALLTNTTERRGNFLSLRLVGVRSSRDAIGATVRIRIGKRTYVQQLIGGDGYHATNERLLVFGVGDADRIDEMTVRWLSGEVQEFRDVPTSKRLVLLEGGDLLNLP